MSFHPITVGTDTYNQTGPGLYTEQSVTLGGPQDYFRVSGGTTSRIGRTNASITKHVQQDVLVGDDTKRQSVIASLQLSADRGVTIQDVRAEIENLYNFLDEPTLNRIMLGES